MGKTGIKRLGVGSAFLFGGVALTSVNFVFAAIQGDYGHLKRVQIEAEEQILIAELAEIRKERQRIENLTKRLSDAYLDLDLLDEQARKRLGYARPNEVIIK